MKAHFTDSTKVKGQKEENFKKPNNKKMKTMRTPGYTNLSKNNKEHEKNENAEKIYITNADKRCSCHT